MSWPYLRYETTSQQLANNVSPVMPHSFGTEFYTFPTWHPKYVSTERTYPSTSGSWRAESLTVTNKNLYRTFWETTLARGKYDFTMIDHRGRCLFDASWNAWKTSFQKGRGCTGNVTLDFESPFPWSAPLFAMYPSTTNNMANHLLDTTKNLALGNCGAMVLNSADSNVLRLNGYALTYSDNSDAYAARVSNASFRSGNENSSISVACQFRVPLLVLGDEFDIFNITDGANVFRAYAKRYDASTAYINFEWQKSGFSAEVVQVSALTEIGFTYDTWYDIGFTFDSINAEFHAYYVASASSASAWAKTNNFLNGLTTLTDGIKSDTSPTNYPTGVGWTTITVGGGSDADIFTNAGAKAYIQNVMIFDDFISPFEFNFYRRLWHMWNSKTTGTWPK